MDMVVDRVIRTRRETWQREHEGVRVNRILGIASLGGTTLDNEVNYLIKKLLTGLGIVQVENQARVCHGSTVAGLGASFGRGGATAFRQDLQNSDCIVIEGSNFAEAHPVGFQWVLEAKAHGVKVIHVDPRFTRTSPLAGFTCFAVIHLATPPPSPSPNQPLPATSRNPDMTEPFSVGQLHSRRLDSRLLEGMSESAERLLTQTRR